MIPKKLFEQQLGTPIARDLFARTSREPHVKRLTVSRKSAVNLHLQGLSIKHAHSILDHLDSIRESEAAHRAVMADDEPEKRSKR